MKDGISRVAYLSSRVFPKTVMYSINQVYLAFISYRPTKSMTYLWLCDYDDFKSNFVIKVDSQTNRSI